jgi:hypothetical protein
MRDAMRLWGGLVKTEKVQKAKKETGTCRTAVAIVGLTAPLLRLAFNKLLPPKNERVLSRLALIMKATGEMREKEALARLWRAISEGMFKRKLDEGLKGLARRPLFIDGVLKLANVVNKRPRHAFRALGLRTGRTKTAQDAVKKLMLINRVDMQRFFSLWAATGTDTRRDRAMRGLLFILNKKARLPLLFWRKNGDYIARLREKRTRLLHIMEFLGNGRLRIYFWHWKKKGDAKEIGNLNVNVKV